jgi:Family of unknown function (DUF5985)
MKPTITNFVLTGAIIIMGFFVAGVFFRHFWILTRERLFDLFALAFWVMGLERIALLGIGSDNEFRPYVYFLRLLGFALIIPGIIDKNRKE